MLATRPENRVVVHGPREQIMAPEISRQDLRVIQVVVIFKYTG